MALWKRRREGGPRDGGAERSPHASPPPTAEFLNAAPTVRTSLGADSVVNGRLSFSAPTRIEGTLHGEVRTGELLIIGERGLVDGTIRAATLIVLGKVMGDVAGAERVEVGPQGELSGNVEARTLVVREGGKLNADCRVGPNRASVHLLTARKADGAARD